MPCPDHEEVDGGSQVQWNPCAGSLETRLGWSTLIVCVWQSTHSDSYFSLLQNKKVGLSDSQRACTELKITRTSKTLCDREGRKKRVTESHGITWQCKRMLLETMWVRPNRFFTGLKSSLASYVCLFPVHGNVGCTPVTCSFSSQLVSCPPTWGCVFPPG